MHGMGLTQERLRKISGTTCERFQASGMTDDQVGEDLEDAKHRARAAKHGITFNE